PRPRHPRPLPPSPTRRSSDLGPLDWTDADIVRGGPCDPNGPLVPPPSVGEPIARPAPSHLPAAPPSRPRAHLPPGARLDPAHGRSEEHTSELQSLRHLVCRLL